MKRIVLIAIALAVICSENGYARNSAVPDCRGFLEAYATAKFEGPDTVNASPDFHECVNLESVRKITQTIALFMADWCSLEKI